MDKQHVQVPQMNLKDDGLTHSDPYVYACIKRYMNSDTKEAFPGIKTLTIDTGLNKSTILSSISRLEAAGYINVIKEFGKVNHYKFNDYKKFEIFSYDFLDNPKLTKQEKAYLVAAQQFMWKDLDTSKGSINFDYSTMAEKLGLSLPTLRKREKELQKDNILTLVPTSKKEIAIVDGNPIPTTGLNVYERVYNFNEFCNILAIKFQQTDEHLSKHDSEIQSLKAENEQLRQEQKILQEKQKQMQDTIEQLINQKPIIL